VSFDVEQLHPAQSGGRPRPTAPYIDGVPQGVVFVLFDVQLCSPTSPHLFHSADSTMVEAMEPSTMEPSKETLWQWHLGLISILLFLFGAVSFYDSGFVPSDIFDVPIDYDPRVPNIIEAIPHCIVWPPSVIPFLLHAK
jgi:hypothetical protein